MREKRKVGTPVVAIVQGEKEEEALLKVLDLLPLEGFISPSETVVLVPNLVNTLPPVSGAVVGTETLCALIRWLKEKNQGRLAVAAGPGGAPTTEVLKANGYGKIFAQEGVSFVDLNTGPYIEIPLKNTFPPSTPVNRLWEECDVLVSFTQLKMHEEATLSATLKNIALSWPPAEIHGFPKTQRGIHENLHAFIAAFAAEVTIDLSIVSASPAMIGTGPSHGKAVPTGLLLAGTDPVATDVVCARLLGFMPQAVAYLYQAVSQEIGEGDLKKVNLCGLPLDTAEKIFSRAAYGFEIALDAGRLRPLQLK